jgi:cholesterol 7-dehydrogenase
MNGFIYLWYHAEDDEPNWWPELIPEIESKEWSFLGRSEFKVACHIQEIPENGADIAHLNILHSKAMMCGGEPEFSWFQWDFITHAFGASWKPSDKLNEKHIAYLKVQHQMCLFNKFPLLQMNVEVKQVGPGTVSLVFETIFGRGILFHTVTPVAPLVQKVLHRFYSAKTFIHPYGKLILLGEAIMIERDIRIWNRKTYACNPLLTKEDKMIKSFRRWFSQFYSPNSPKYYFSNNDDNSNTLEF